MSEQGNVSTSACAASCNASPQLQLYQTIIFAMPVIFAFLLLILFCMLYIRRRRNSYVNSIRRMQFVSRGPYPTPVHEYGLSKSFRQRLPIVSFDDKFRESNEDFQCAVCLSDYLPNEKLQQLPVCKHSFHVPCIDEWLAKNVTCPICRTSLQQEDTGNIHTAGADDHRFWEERVVVNDFNEAIGTVRPDYSHGSSSSSSGNAGPSSEITAPRFSIDLSVNLERS